MFWLLIFLCSEQTTKSTKNLFSKQVFHDGKTVYYHTGQLTPKLRMLIYPITFRNNFWTQGQNMSHTHTLSSCNISFLFCLTGLCGIWFFYGLTCLSSSLNAFQMQYTGSLHALQFLSVEPSFSVSLIIKSTRPNLSRPLTKQYNKNRKPAFEINSYRMPVKNCYKATIERSTMRDSAYLHTTSCWKLLDVFETPLEQGDAQTLILYSCISW